jgi:tRNA(Arg) A34 adenosine deaminase TadA
MPRKKFHVIATIYDKRGRPLSVGVNSYDKTHPLQAKYAIQCNKPEKVFLHAEIAAIVKLSKPWRAHTIKVERYTSEGVPVNASPCVICRKAIEAIGIKNIIHT